MGTIDNVYIMNYLINRQLGKEGGRLVALFVDLRAAFDSLDRRVLVKAMRERGIREGLTERVAEILRETKSKIRIGREVGESFWTVRGVRQGCPLSPLLFNLMTADMEEVLSRVKWGGVRVGDGRICTLSYADDTENEDEMRSMIWKDWRSTWKGRI